MFLPRKLYTSATSLWVLQNRIYVWFLTLEVVICGAIRQIPLSVNPAKIPVPNQVHTTRVLPLHMHL
jgi:hypothetical protein